MIWPSIALLAFVTLQRLVELPLAQANTKQLLAAGGHEVGASHYPLIVALHAAWLITLWWLAPGRPIDIPFLLLFLLIEAGRVWVLRTLGPRWTTRIIVVPGEALVASGPYRFVRHPNYLVVIGEVAVLPLVFGLWDIAIIFSLLNAVILTVRIKAENTALGH
ncbi:isoprenylcysteine carboxylmethyltransferase family protein [Sphingomonas sp.]|uniref:isoprenylcysteine carboxyl methyltransferase family protein n=1 Tax=Sphingomonas sp. TaxID=28214 RepID=UPI0025E51FCB|nr:isoprenylcysteine carboxylmethyltransferase family protein [Sphingomonas sp.]